MANARNTETFRAAAWHRTLIHSRDSLKSGRVNLINLVGADRTCGQTADTDHEHDQAAAQKASGLGGGTPRDALKQRHAPEVVNYGILLRTTSVDLYDNTL